MALRRYGEPTPVLIVSRSRRLLTYSDVGLQDGPKVRAVIAAPLWSVAEQQHFHQDRTENPVD